MADIKQYIAEQAANIVNGARRGAYGKPENNFHRIALLWQAWLDARNLRIVQTQVLADGEEDFAEYRLVAGDVSPMMRLMKEARLCETPDHLDSHMDIVGYALTGAEVAGVQMPVEKETADQKELIDRVMKECSAIFEGRMLQKDKEIAYLRQQLDMIQADNNARIDATGL